jgi:hypothetical protein
MDKPISYQELDDAIMKELWAGNRTHKGIVTALAHLADKYSSRVESQSLRYFGEIVSRRTSKLKREDMIRHGVNGGWIPVPEQYRKAKGI